MNNFTSSFKNSCKALFISICLMAAAGMVSGQNLFNEDFNYTGALTSNGWTAHSGAASFPISTVTPGLSYNGYLGSAVGNAALVDSRGGEDDNKTFTSQNTNGQSIFFAFLVKIPDTLSVNKTGDYFFHSGSPGGATFSLFAARVFAKYTSSTQVVNFGISNTSTATYGTTSFSKGVTYLLVIKYTISTGAGNDPVSLWVLPSGVPASEAAAGTPEVNNTATAGTDAINAIGLRQGSATTSVQVIVDGIRVGNTWSDAVTPGYTGAITGAATATAFTTTYGTPSAAQSFAVSGTGLTAAITATAPSGFEVSNDGSSYAGTASIAQSGGTANGNISVRLAATAPFSGSYNGKNIVLSSPGCGNVNIVTAASGNSVAKKELTVTAGNQSVSYGTAAASVLAAGSYTLNGFVNGETSSVVSGSVSYTTNYLSTDNAGTSGVTITPDVSLLTAANYSFSAVNGNITIVKANQTITFSAISDKLDTDAPFTLNGTASSGLPVSYVSSNTAVATVSGNTVTIVGPGSTTITASQAGDGNYNAAGNVDRSFNVSGASLQDQTISFGALATAHYGDAPITLTGTATSGLTVSYSSSNTSVATVSGDVVTILAPGSTTITASQIGNGSYNPAPNVSQTLTVLAKQLTVTGAFAENKDYDGNSNAVINLSSATLVGKVGGDVVTVSGGGTFDDPNAGFFIGVTANLTLGGADAYKYSLIQPTGLFADINVAQQTITFNALAAKTYGDASFALHATASSGLPVSYSSSDPAVATIVDSIVTIVGAGSAIITASQSGSINYDPAADVSQTLTVNKGSQTITFAALANKLYNDAPFTLNGTVNSGLTITYVSSNPAVATVSGNTVTLTGVIGTTNITASQPGDANWNAAADVIRSLEVSYPVLLGWQLSTAAGNEVTYNATTNDASLDTSRLSRGAGIAPTALARAFSSNGFSFSTTKQLAIDSLDYYEFSVKPANLKKVSLSRLNARMRRTSTGPNMYIWRYSINGTNFQDIGSAVSFTSTSDGGVDQAPLNLSAVAGLQSVGYPINITFRLYMWGSTSGSSTYAIGRYGSGVTSNSLSVEGLMEDLSAPVITSSLSASGSVGAAFSYNITATNSPTSFTATGLPGGLTLNGSTGLISGTPFATGSYTIPITATNIVGTDSKDLSLTINPGNQTISFGALAAKTYGVAPFTLNGTASSGLTVSYSSSDPSIASVSGNTVTIHAAGSVIITASQAGDANWNAAADVNRTLTIDKANQTITFGALADVNDNDAPFALTGTASSGLTVEYTSSDPLVATVSGNTVTIVGPGTTTITASQPGDGNYNAAAPVSRTLLVKNTTLLNQTITFNALSNKTYGDAPFQLTASASSGLTVSYASSNAAIASVAGDMVTIHKPGSVTITASQGGGSGYNPAVDVSQGLTIDIKTLTVSGAVAQDKVFDSTVAATISGATLVGVVGSDDVNVSGGGVFDDIQGGTNKAVTAQLVLTGADIAYYSLVQPTGLTASITPAVQVVTFSAIPTKTTLNPDFRIFATSNKGLPITFSSSNTAVATILGDTAIHIVGPGTSVITASQAGTNNYQPASASNNLKVLAALAKWSFDGVTLSGTGNTPVIAGGTAADLGTNTAGSSFGAYHANALAVWSNPTGNGSVKAASATYWSVGDYWQFTVNTKDYYDINVLYDQTGSNTGPRHFSLNFSLNGSSYQYLATDSVTNDSWSSTIYKSVSTFEANLDSIRDLNGNTVHFRVVNSSTTAINGGLTQTGGTNRMDNFIVTGTPCDPPTIALGSVPAVCPGVTATSISYSGTTGAANQYGIFFDATAQAAGFVNMSYSDLVASPIGIAVPGGAPSGVYNALFSVRDSITHCSSEYAITIEVRTPDLSISGITSPYCFSSGSATVTGNIAPAGTFSGTGVTDLGNGTATFSPVAAGSYVISYSGTDSYGCTGTHNLTVDVLADVTAGSVSGAASVCAGGSTGFTVSGATSGGSWSSSDNAVATVDASTGLVTGVASGSATITYTVSGCGGTQTSSASLTVNPLPNAGVISGASSVCTGSSSSYTSDGDAGGTWSSSNTAVATVNGSGLVSGISAGSATISYTVTNGCGTQAADYSITINNCNSVVNITAFIQGYYSGAGMQPVLMNSGVAGATSSQCDTLTVEIHDGATGNLIGAAVQTIINTDGTAQASFPALSGSHYLVLKHRNAMETWSAAPVTMGPTVSYDFSTGAAQAYGSNQVQVGAGVYALWSGDLNQDGMIETTDYSQMENDVISILFGYYNSDLTGDGMVETSDYSLMENNVIQIIFVSKPF